MTDGYLSFAHANVGYVLDGEENATVRYNFEREFEAGERVRLRTPSGVPFAVATIEETYRAPLRLAYTDMVGVDERAHPAESTSDLQARLERHYDAEIAYDDVLDVIYFDVENPAAEWACDDCGVRKSTCWQGDEQLCNECAGLNLSDEVMEEIDAA